jgi:adenine/guanine phosphoribosyltransferase-like PRPP-binding protein
MQIHDFESLFKRAGAFWKHDGKLKRPFAELTTPAEDGRRRISDGFFNADRLVRYPALLAQTAGHLIHNRDFVALRDRLGGPAPNYQRSTTQSDEPVSIRDQRIRISRVIGAAYGGITLAHEVARHIGCEMAYAIHPTRVNDRGETVVIKDEMSLERFEPDFLEGETVLLVEDTLTTGRTMAKARKALKKSHPTARILPCLLTICNRSGKTEIDGMPVFSVIEPDFKVWVEGENPYTRGAEQVEPLRPKGKNWDILNAQYA